VPMTSRARAICVELGMVKALIRELDFLESGVGIVLPKGYVVDNRNAAQVFSRLHARQECACGGAGRKYTSVRPTLHALDSVTTDERLGLAKLLYGLWISSSRSVHFPRLEHIAADAPGGAELSSWSVRDRAITLYNLVLVQSYIAGFAATPFAGRQRQISWSAVFLLDEVQLRTRPGAPVRTR
jgi:hypothetical protein